MQNIYMHAAVVVVVVKKLVGRKWRNNFEYEFAVAVAVAPLSSYIHASHTVINMSHIT